MLVERDTALRQQKPCSWKVHDADSSSLSDTSWAQQATQCSYKGVFSKPIYRLLTPYSLSVITNSHKTQLTNQKQQRQQNKQTKIPKQQQQIKTHRERLLLWCVCNGQFYYSPLGVNGLLQSCALLFFCQSYPKPTPCSRSFPVIHHTQLSILPNANPLLWTSPITRGPAGLLRRFPPPVPPYWLKCCKPHPVLLPTPFPIG